MDNLPARNGVVLGLEKRGRGGRRELEVVPVPIGQSVGRSDGLIELEAKIRLPLQQPIAAAFKRFVIDLFEKLECHERVPPLFGGRWGGLRLRARMAF